MSMMLNEDGVRLTEIEKDYGDGRTKQAFKDSTDINKMLAKAQVNGSIAHLVKYPEVTYGQFDANFDLLTARSQIEKAGKIFGDLPSEVRREFNNDPLKFVAFAGNPVNNAKLADLLPSLAEPGRMMAKPLNSGVEPAVPVVAPEAPVVPVPPSGGGGD